MARGARAPPAPPQRTIPGKQVTGQEGGLVITAEQGMGDTGWQHMLPQGVILRPSHCGLAETPTSLNSLALCVCLQKAGNLGTTPVWGTAHQLVGAGSRKNHTCT